MARGGLGEQCCSFTGPYLNIGFESFVLKVNCLSSLLVECIPNCHNSAHSTYVPMCIDMKAQPLDLDIRYF